MNTYYFIKRFFDVIFALLGIFIVFPLVLIVVLILMILGEKKPIFPQQRIGKNGRLFTLYKLRTISSSNTSTTTSPLTSSEDERITPFCEFLRNSKIDEFPQFVNVLKGDLSFVGPRPLLPEIFDYYPLEIQEPILSVKPGLTGMGSLVFRNENGMLKKIPAQDHLAFYHKNICPQKGALEVWYINHQCFWTDTKILFLTPWVLINPNFNFLKKWFKGLIEIKVNLKGVPEKIETKHLNSSEYSKNQKQTII